MEDTDVETQPVSGKRFDTTDEIRLDAEIDAFGLNESTDTFNERIVRQFFRRKARPVHLLQGVPTQRSLESEDPRRQER